MAKRDKYEADSDPTLPRSPLKSFKSYILAGVGLGIYFILVTSIMPGSRSAADRDFSWLLPAAGVFATVAVATALIDPSRLLPEDHASDDAPRNDSDPAARIHAEQQLTVLLAVLASTGTLSAICAVVSFQQFAGPDGNPDYSVLSEIIVTAGAHAIIAGMCSLGFGFKNEQFLRKQNFKRAQEHYESIDYQTLWGLDSSEFKLPPPKKDRPEKRTIFAYVIYFCLYAVIALIAWGTFFLTNKFYDVPQDTGWIFVPVTYASLLLGSNYFSSRLLIHYEAIRRSLAHARDAAVTVQKHFTFALVILINIAMLLSLFILFLYVIQSYGTAYSASEHSDMLLFLWLFPLYVITTMHFIQIFYGYRTFLSEFKFGDYSKKWRWLEMHLTVGPLRRVIEKDVQQMEKYLKSENIPQKN